MNRTTYNTARRSIRDNGLAYTARHAADTDDFNTMFICDDLANIMRETDWLALRQQWARHGNTVEAFKLTTTVTL